MLRYALPALLFASALPAYAQSPVNDVPLIERAKIFGNPSKSGGRISPDGKWLSWIAPRDGVLNVWVAPASDLTKARPLTDEKVRPIRGSFWSPDSKTLLFIQDKGGDENFLLYGVNVLSGKQINYTPFEKTRVQIVQISSKVKDRILIGINNRDPRWHDVYSLDLASGKLTLVQHNDGYGGYLADEQLNLRLASKPRSDGGATYFRVKGGKVETTPLADIGLDDSQTTAPLTFTTDGKTLYWTDSRGRNTSALLAQDVASGKTTVVAEDARADIANALYDQRTGRVQAYSVNYLQQEYVPLSNDVKGDLEFLKNNTKGQFSVVSRTDADDKWLVAVDAVTAPPSAWLYERRTKHLTQLYVTRPELEGAPLVPMYPQEIKARDGLTLVSYLTLPQAAQADSSGHASKPVPLVLLVHGGPWARDGYGYNSTHQWLANRGYAVLSVNYRGSTGFGKQFISAGDLQWGRKMHDDLLDAVQWAVKSGVTTADKVAIMGGSYGGYATLAGMAFTPATFACGVDIVGPSNLFTLLQTIPPYWESIKQQFYKRMGDPTTEEGRALLKERSPLNFAANIQRPLLIGQGANDPRVNVRESDQIVAEMAAKNIPVTYVLFPDEGHGFARPVNNIAFNAVAENFLGKCLDGRAEAIGGTIRASTAQIKHGAEFAPGLQEALR
ncbi:MULTISPECIES: S9 family peptidase [unclassified Janthinobacterium]|uniref:S9 family peptidase n=1 Tax=unclassified Janthinobacterium TaxID=2610881 RepID=UPI001612264F|nr:MULTISPECIES: S9 family peptidase [unclassified Janthinobacterium]MBB5607718.1 dipeptidyl aminopeptidase/acylaminoacyl peptidase [Janthinobacterium sp. S3T4]MBB5613134.1 dipeptidyl aminopeptidase/acylaminoacyl peptidase [Janthinobacterium sp. S3M3]